MDLEGELDRLFALPSDQFVPERDALVKRVRAAGDREGAARLKATRRPTVPAWAVNQLWARDRDRIAGMQRAGAELRALQTHPGDGRSYTEATTELRRRVRELVEAARAVLADGGHAVDPNLERVRELLVSLAAWGNDPPVPPGRLVDTLPQPGLEVLLGSSLPGPRPKPRLVPEPEEPEEIPEEPEEPEEPEVDEQVEEARAEVAFLRRRSVRQEREAEQAQHRATAARERAEVARAALIAAEAEEEAAGAAASEAQRVSEATRAALADAEVRARG